MNEASIEELKQLLSLVRCGRLFDVQEWLAEVKPFRTTTRTRINPILESVRIGFHSIVEVFLSAGLTSQELTELLAEAVRIHREDLVRLLIDNGADDRSVPFEDTLYEWHPGRVRLFLKHGADFVMGSPFAGAFICKRRTALGIFKGLLEKDPSIIAQANEALVYHVKKRDRKWISLMLWLGANVRAPVVDRDYPGSATTALRQAAICGDLEVLKKAKINPATDNVVELLDVAAFCRNPEVVEYLLGFNPDVNATIEDGEAVLESYFRSLAWDLDPVYMPRDPGPSLKCIELLAKRGARWQPKERSHYRRLRKGLCKTEVWKAIDILNKLIAAEVFGRSVLRQLISTPKMKEVLSRGYGKDDRILEAAGFVNSSSRSKKSRQRS